MFISAQHKRGEDGPDRLVPGVAVVRIIPAMALSLVPGAIVIVLNATHRVTVGVLVCERSRADGTSCESHERTWLEGHKNLSHILHMLPPSDVEFIPKEQQKQSQFALCP